MIGAGGETGADTEAVDRDSLGAEADEVGLVEGGGGEDSHLGEATVVEDRAHPPGVAGEVARVDAHRLDSDPRRRQPGRHLDHPLCALLRVVGVDKQDHVVRLGAGKGLEGAHLAHVCLHIRVGHGAEDRDCEARRGEGGGAAVEAGEVAGARREQGCLTAVGAA